MRLIINIDGGSRGNPGPAAAGVVIRDASDHTPICEAGFFLGTATNNVAEYTGLIRALKIAADLSPEYVAIFSDSQLMVRQLLGEYKVKSEDLKPLYNQARSLLGKLSDWSLAHVLRNKNKRADELVNQCLDVKRDVILHSPQGMTATPSAKTAPPAESESTAMLLVIDSSPLGKCPAAMKPGQRFTINTTTPPGLCIHAARAALNGEATCSQCNARIKMIKS